MANPFQKIPVFILLAISGCASLPNRQEAPPAEALTSPALSAYTQMLADPQLSDCLRDFRRYGSVISTVTSTELPQAGLTRYHFKSDSRSDDGKVLTVQLNIDETERRFHIPQGSPGKIYLCSVTTAARS